jgi:hypothetical protein
MSMAAKRGRQAFPHIVETDCVAGVVRLELRCAERIFIYLETRREKFQ